VPDVTTLLREWSRGDRSALDRLVPLVYLELRKIARRHMRQERSGHSLQPTALINEAYLRLADAQHVDWNDRVHFFAVAARVMRRILVDHARARQSQKRGGDAAQVPLDEGAVLTATTSPDVIALDDALEALSTFDERKSRVIELRFFGGLSVDETAVVLQVSPDTVHRDWRLAKTWLRQQIRTSGQL